MRNFGASGQRFSPVTKVIEVVALVVKLPRSRRDICDVLGLSTRNGSVDTILRGLRDEGLIYIESWSRRGMVGNWTPVFAWQPSVCALPDAPRPVPKDPYRGFKAPRCEVEKMEEVA